MGGLIIPDNFLSFYIIAKIDTLGIVLGRVYGIPYAPGNKYGRLLGLFLNEHQTDPPEFEKTLLVEL